MLIEPELTPLQFDVTDKVLGPATIFRQRARPELLTIKILPNGCREVTLVLRRIQYARNLDGSYGDELAERDTNAASNLITLTGNSSCAVNMDGKPRYRLISDSIDLNGVPRPGSARNMLTYEVETFEPGQNYRQWLEAKPEQYMFQDRYYGLVCARFDVNIDDLVQETTEEADAAPSAFA
jgi:hypothetical protein